MGKKVDISVHFEIGELFNHIEIIEYVRGNFDPDEIFKESQLDIWAYENGYEKN